MQCCWTDSFSYDKGVITYIQVEMMCSGYVLDTEAQELNPAITQERPVAASDPRT